MLSGVLGKQRGSLHLLPTFVTDDALRGAINAVSDLNTILFPEFDNNEFATVQSGISVLCLLLSKRRLAMDHINNI